MSFLRLGSFAFVLVGFACGGRVDSELVGQPTGSGTGTSSGGASGSSSSSTSGTTSSGSKSSSSTGSTSSGGQCDGIPDCDPGDTKLSGKDKCPPPNPGFGSTCYSREACGVTTWCVPACNETPKCPVGSIAGTTCPPGDTCFSVTQCGKTIQCITACEGPRPICDPGDTEVASQAGCLQDDAVCYTRSTCNFTIWCTGPSK